MPCTSAGWSRRAINVLKGIYDHCRDFATSRIYPGIPEYVSDRGRGMYTYLTGSASWLLLTLVTQVFGVRGQRGQLAIAPKLVPEQFDELNHARMGTLFAGQRLEVTFHNPDRLSYGAYRVKRVSLDGADVAVQRAGDAVILARDVIASLPDSPRPHDLRVELGPWE